MEIKNKIAARCWWKNRIINTSSPIGHCNLANTINSRDTKTDKKTRFKKFNNPHPPHFLKTASFSNTNIENTFPLLIFINTNLVNHRTIGLLNMSLKNFKKKICSKKFWKKNRLHMAEIDIDRCYDKFLRFYFLPFFYHLIFFWQ